MGLNQVTVPATPRLPLKRSKAQGTTTTTTTTKPRCSRVQPIMGTDKGRGYPTAWHYPHLSTTTTALTVPLRKVGDLYAPSCILLNTFQTLIRPSSGASEYLLCCVGWLEACWCYVAGLAVGDVVSECRLNHVEQYIIKQLSSSWSTFIQILAQVYKFLVTLSQTFPSYCIKCFFLNLWRQYVLRSLQPLSW